MARFIRRGKTKYRFATTVANLAAPTRAEITSSVALTSDIAEVGGLAIANSPIATPDMDTIFTKSIIGEDTAEDSSLTFYDQDDSVVIRTALAKDTPGFLLYFPYGDTPTKRMEVWPVRTTGVNDQVSAGNEAATYVVGFAITDTPRQSAVVPAAS